MEPIYIVVCQEPYGGGEKWIRAFSVESKATVFAFTKASQDGDDCAIYTVLLNNRQDAKLVWGSKPHDQIEPQPE